MTLFMFSFIYASFIKGNLWWWTFPIANKPLTHNHHGIQFHWPHTLWNGVGLTNLACYSYVNDNKASLVLPTSDSIKHLFQQLTILSCGGGMFAYGLHVSLFSSSFNWRYCIIVLFKNIIKNSKITIIIIKAKCRSVRKTNQQNNYPYKQQDI